MTDPFSILASQVGKLVRVHVYDGPASASLTTSSSASALSDHTTLCGTLLCLDDFGNLMLKDWACSAGPREGMVSDAETEAQLKGGRPAKRPREQTVAGRLGPCSGALRFIRASQVTSIGLM